MLLDSLRHQPTRSVGGELLALTALDELRFADSLRAEGLSDRDARLASAVVHARMLHPCSEREALEKALSPRERSLQAEA